MPRGGLGVPKRLSEQERLRRKLQCEQMRRMFNGSSWNKGKRTGAQSPEHVAKRIRKHRENPMTIEKCRANGIKSALKQAGRRASCPEHYIRGWLDARGVDYVYQCELEGFLVDFYIPSMRLVLEYDGTYWHSRPGQKERDVNRDSILTAAGYRVLRVTEMTLSVVLKDTFVIEEVS